MSQTARILMFAAALLVIGGAPRWSPFAIFPAGSALAQGDGGDPLEYLPANHWAYEELERLATLGVLPAAALRSRPLPRSLIARALAPCLDRPEMSRDPGLLRLRREFAREIAWTGRAAPEAETPPLLVAGGGASALRISATAGVDARLATGEEADLGPDTFLGARGSFHAPPHVTVTEDLRIREVAGARGVGDALIKGTDVAVDIERATVAIRTGALEILAGRDRFRWGPSRRGGLLLSGSAPPWTFVGYAAQLGPRLRGTAVHGTLNAREGRYLAGHRLEWSWGSRLVVGAAEVARYESPSPELLYVLNLVPYTVVERLVQLDTEDPSERRTQRNNVLWSADVGARIARGHVVYAEALADDIASETSHAPDRLGFLAGHRAVFPMGTRRVSAGIEAAKVWNYVYSVYYTGDCDCDLSHRGEPLGFPDGPDVERADLWADLDLGREWRVGIEASLFRRGEGRLGEAWSPFDSTQAGVDASRLSGDVGTRRSVALRAGWWPADNVEAGGTVGVERVEGGPPLPASRTRTFFTLAATARY